MSAKCKKHVTEQAGTVADAEANVIAQVVFSLTEWEAEETSDRADGRIEFKVPSDSLHFVNTTGPFCLRGTRVEARIIFTKVGLPSGRGEFRVTGIPKYLDI